MLTYCKTCRCTHAAWTRLNDGLICGRCGARERNQRIVPLNTHAAAKPMPSAHSSSSTLHNHV